jgi:UPF0271 protein
LNETIMNWDLNCDLGEGEPPARTRALMRWITSANVACGGHAGNVRSMAACVRWAMQNRVRIGAHPGLASGHDFGRGRVSLSPDDLETLLFHQVGALHRLALEAGAALHHVKLHGALYHATETNVALRRRYIETVRFWWPDTIIYAQAGGNVARLARRKGVPVMEEGFLDRAYLDPRTLAPRSRPGALWTDTRKVLGRLRLWQETGAVLSRSGKACPLKVRTWCVHSDTPNALRMVRTVARFFSGER